MTPELLEVKGLTKSYHLPHSRTTLRALHDVGFSIKQGKTLGVVGESGSGKSTLAKLIAGIERPDSGSIRFEGKEMTTASKRDWRACRTRMQMVFQDPGSSLDPRMTVAGSIAEVYRTWPGLVETSIDDHVSAQLETVELAGDMASRYPSELSGGQRQRVAIARALAMQPRMLVCDEVVSALDVTVQAQMIDLLQRIQRDLSVGMIFISHDLAVVREIAESILVLYGGVAMEYGEARAVCERPINPYTQLLLRSSLLFDPFADISHRDIDRPPRRASIASSGCPFQERCPHAHGVCAKTPALVSVESVGGRGHQVACHEWTAARDEGRESLWVHFADAGS